MPRKKVENTEIPDAAPVLYQDRSGPPRSTKRSEGADNFAAITQAAIESVEREKARTALEASA